ncbi:MAG: DUF3084 domain-containing protein [Fimbriimonadales bacterium]
MLFVIMGGLIAYLGDWLGRRMGKKRLRIGKLRPRHTATFFTVLMGMLIPLATTYGIVTQSAAVRQWIMQGPELVREKQALETEIETNQVSLAKLENQAVKRQEQLSEIQTMLTGASAARDEAVNERNQERTRLENARKEISAAERRESQIDRRVASLRDSEKTLQANVGSLKEELSASQESLANAKQESQRLYEETEGLKQNSIDLTRQISDLEEERDRQSQRAEDARKDANEWETRAQQNFDRILDLRRTISDLEGTLIGAAEGIEAVRTSSVVFRKDEELARLAIPAGVSESQAREKITEIIKMADVVAKERGVRPDSMGRAAALDTRIRRLPDGTILEITPEDQIQAFVNEMVLQRQDLLLMIGSFYNYFSKDDTFVPLNLNMYPNRTVFSNGETVAETVINGSNSEEEILDAIILFLRTDVRLAAQEAGMIPVQGQDVSIGEITYMQMTDLVRRIRQRGGPAKVVAEAAGPTKSADSLTLRFQVRNP